MLEFAYASCGDSIFCRVTDRGDGAVVYSARLLRADETFEPWNRAPL